jgi:hypothetical protein
VTGKGAVLVDTGETFAAHAERRAVEAARAVGDVDTGARNNDVDDRDNIFVSRRGCWRGTREPMTSRFVAPALPPDDCSARGADRRALKPLRRAIRFEAVRRPPSMTLKKAAPWSRAREAKGI